MKKSYGARIWRLLSAHDAVAEAAALPVPTPVPIQPTDSPGPVDAVPAVPADAVDLMLLGRHPDALAAFKEQVLVGRERLRVDGESALPALATALWILALARHTLSSDHNGARANAAEARMLFGELETANPGMFCVRRDALTQLLIEWSPSR